VLSIIEERVITSACAVAPEALVNIKRPDDTNTEEDAVIDGLLLRELATITMLLATITMLLATITMLLTTIVCFTIAEETNAWNVDIAKTGTELNSEILLAIMLENTAMGTYTVSHMD